MQLVLNGDTRPIPFLIVQSSDHITGLTGASPTVTISKNGGAFGSPAGTVSEIGNGWYELTPSSADTNTNGVLLLHATATSGDPSDLATQVVAFSPYNANLAANIVQISGAAVSASTAQLGVNVVNIAGQAAQLDGNNLLKIDVADIAGSAVNTASAQLGVNVVSYASGEDPATLVLAGSVESGVNVQAALRYIAAAVAGVVSGASGTTVIIQEIGNAGTTRIVATVDASGDRSAVTLS